MRWWLKNCTGAVTPASARFCLQLGLVAAEQLQHLQRAVDRRLRVHHAAERARQRRVDLAVQLRLGLVVVALPRPADHRLEAHRDVIDRPAGSIPCTGRASGAPGAGTRSASSAASSAPRWRRRRRGRRRRGPRRPPRRHGCRGRSRRDALGAANCLAPRERAPTPARRCARPVRPTSSWRSAGLPCVT